MVSSKNLTFSEYNEINRCIKMSKMQEIFYSQILNYNFLMNTSHLMLNGVKIYGKICTQKKYILYVSVFHVDDAIITDPCHFNVSNKKTNVERLNLINQSWMAKFWYKSATKKVIPIRQLEKFKFQKSNFVEVI